MNPHQVYSVPLLQKGNHVGGVESPLSRGVYHASEPQGRLLEQPHQVSFAEIPGVLFGNSEISFSGFPLWAEHRPQCFYETDKAHPKRAPLGGNTGCLHLRLAGLVPYGRLVSGPCFSSSGSHPQEGFPYQFQETPIGLISTLPVAGNFLEHIHV